MHLLISTLCFLSCSLQLCIDAQIPVALGGLGGEAIYIDTEASFSVRRLQGGFQANEVWLSMINLFHGTL